VDVVMQFLAAGELVEHGLPDGGGKVVDGDELGRAGRYLPAEGLGDFPDGGLGPPP
jgi:hypothetical protein